MIALAFLAIMATAFWTMIFTGFIDSGFKAVDPKRGASEATTITPECAWPYSVSHKEAQAVCRLFYNLSPEQRAEVLRARK